MAEKYYVVVGGNGSTRWFAWPGTERKLHRLDGPAVEYSTGGRRWYQNGVLHRLDGPAVECPDGYRSWWQNGRRHRLDGPAVIDEDGAEEYWFNGTQYTQAAWRAATQPVVEMTIAEIETLLGKRIKVVK